MSRYDYRDFPLEPEALTVKRLELERIRYCRQAAISRIECRAYPHSFSEFDREQRYIFSAEFAGRKASIDERREVVVPADWWQHFKQRWFPAWALRRWPLRYQVHTLEVHADASALFPEIAPFKAHHMTICAFDSIDVRRV